MQRLAFLLRSAVLMAPADNGEGGGGGGGEQKKEEPAPPSASEIAELRAAKAQLDTINANKAKVDADANAARLALAKEAEEKGELKKALDLQKGRNAELEPLAAKAEKWAAFEAAELKRIDEAATKLPAAAQKALAAAQTLEQKQAFLEAFGSTSAPGNPPKPEHKGTNSSGAPAPTSKVDFGAINDVDTLRTAKAADPAGWESYKGSLRGSTDKPLTTFERRRLAQTKKG